MKLLIFFIRNIFKFLFLFLFYQLIKKRKKFIFSKIPLIKIYSNKNTKLLCAFEKFKINYPNLVDFYK